MPHVTLTEVDLPTLQQIHTTGTDLPFLSTFNARAVQTLSKDMVWRDYVQGAW